MSASTASGEPPPLRTHAHACVHGRPRSAQHRFNRNQSTISRSRCGATRSRSLDPRGLSRARTRIRGNTRGKSKPKPGQSVGALMWPPVCCLRQPEYLYIRPVLRFFSLLSLLLFVSSCANISFDRSSAAVIPLPLALDERTLFSLVHCMYASTRHRLHSAIYFTLFS